MTYDITHRGSCYNSYVIYEDGCVGKEDVKKKKSFVSGDTRKKAAGLLQALRIVLHVSPNVSVTYSRGERSSGSLRFLRTYQHLTMD